jgi:hypothetical protein
MVPVQRVKEHKDNLICLENGTRLLKTAMLYGRNASGKTNILRGLEALKDFVSQSSDYKIDQKIPHYQPFKLDPSCLLKPTQFEIDFLAHDGMRYQYGVSFLRDRILTESLVFYPRKQPAKLFKRESGKEMDFGIYLKGDKRGVERQLADNVLFLSKGANSNIEQLKQPYLFFKTYLFTTLGLQPFFETDLILSYTSMIADKKDPYFSTRNVGKLIRVADTGIDSISVNEIPEEKIALPPNISEEKRKRILRQLKYEIKTIHKMFAEGKPVDETSFNIWEESAGTIKLLAIGAMMLDALGDGTFLVVDELDKGLHPLLTKALIRLFHNAKTNLKNSQLLFATHDVSLLDNSLLRRDQIWFTEKEGDGATKLYSLSDIRGVRKELPFEKWYMSGRFGATPSINELELVLEPEDE